MKKEVELNKESFETRTKDLLEQIVTNKINAEKDKKNFQKEVSIIQTVIK